MSRAYIAEIRINNILDFASEYDNGNSGSTKTIDWNNGNLQKITMSANCTFSFTDISGTPCAGLLLKVVQNETGGYTITWPSGILWADGTPPTVPTGANERFIVQFHFDGTDYHGVYTPKLATAS
jgi:hypothetical protein